VEVDTIQVFQFSFDAINEYKQIQYLSGERRRLLLLQRGFVRAPGQVWGR